MCPEMRVENARRLQEQILALHHRQLTDQAGLAFLLARLDETRGYLDLGYASVAAFARSRLGYSAGKTRDLLKLVERLQTLPRIEEAFSAGELPWTKARAVARVATVEDEEHWLEEARHSSRRQIESQVADELGEELGIRLRLEFPPTAPFSPEADPGGALDAPGGSRGLA